MGVYFTLFAFLCFCAVYANETANISLKDALDNPQGYDFNKALKQLFDEMHSSMNLVITETDTPKVIGRRATRDDDSQYFVRRMKRILIPDNVKGNRKDAKEVTKALGVFKNLFNNMAGGITKLYAWAEDENESKHYMGITPVKREDSVQPILDRWKKIDKSRKHAGIYYEDESESGEGNETVSQSAQEMTKQIANVTKVSHRNGTVTSERVIDDTEGSGQQDDEDETSGSGSGDDDEDDEEDENFTSHVSLKGYHVRNVVYNGYQTVVNYVAKNPKQQN